MTGKELLKGKIAVVTGAARGVGRGIALSLAKAGTTVYVADRRTRQKSGNESGTIEDTIDQIKEAGGDAIAVEVDFTKDQQVEALFRQVETTHGKLDVLVANAMNGNAIPFRFGKLWELDPSSWYHMFTSGVRNHILAACKGAFLLIKSKGLLILTGYHAANHPQNGGNLYYDLAMNAITRLTQGLAYDFSSDGVNVVAISPGLVRTEVITAAMGSNPPGSQSIEYPGRAVVALASDKDVQKHNGKILPVGELARTYSFKDTDGTQPE